MTTHADECSGCVDCTNTLVVHQLVATELLRQDLGAAAIAAAVAEWHGILQEERRRPARGSTLRITVTFESEWVMDSGQVTVRGETELA